MNHDELEKLWESLKDIDLTKGNFTSSVMNLPQMDANMVQKIKAQINNRSFYTYPYPGISPTDVDADGMYEYQEPEQDEQGTYYGYKVLHKQSVNRYPMQGCDCEECSCLVSPRYSAKWIDGELQADKVPSEDTMYGIHFTKRHNHPELEQYHGIFRGSQFNFDESGSWVLVKCALSGTIVETAQGFRAEHAQIIGVEINGNWQSYQDYKECTRAHSRQAPETQWRYIGTRATPPKGIWNAYYDPPTDT